MAEDASHHKVLNLLGAVPFMLAHGIKPADLLRRVGLPPYFLLNPDSWLPRRYCFALGNALKEMTGDRYAALHLSEPVSLAQYGAWTEVIQQGPSLRLALLLAGRHINLIQTGSSLRLRERGHKARLTFEFASWVPVWDSNRRTTAWSLIGRFSIFHFVTSSLQEQAPKNGLRKKTFFEPSWKGSPTRS